MASLCRLRWTRIGGGGTCLRCDRWRLIQRACVDPTVCLMFAYDRHRLYFGPYHTPIFRYGAKVTCEVRGEVRIVGSACRIQWFVRSREMRQVAGAVRLASPSRHRSKL